MRPEEPDFSSRHSNLDNSSMETSQAAIEEEVGKKKMRKKTFRMSQEVLDYCLSLRLGLVSRKLIQRDPPAAAEMEKEKQRLIAEQERMRREYEAKGYATYVAEVPDDGARYQGEVTDDEDEEKDTAALGQQTEGTIDDKKEEGEAEVNQVEVTIDDDKKCEDTQATVDEKKEEDAAAQPEVIDDNAAPWFFPKGRGRRRFRPGVVKQAGGGGVKKIIM